MSSYIYILKSFTFRFKILENSLKKSETDGLNTLNYNVTHIKKNKLYTNFIVTY